MAVSFLKKSNRDVVAKVSGNSGTFTIPLSDLVVNNEVINDTPIVSLVGVTFTGHFDSVITVSRNNTTLLTLPATAANFLDMTGDNFPRDNSNDTSDIVVTIAGGQGECWLRLKKVSGFEVVKTPIVGSNDLWDNTITWDSQDIVWV